MHNQQVVVNFIIKKLHYLEGDSAAFLGGVCGGTLAFIQHIDLLEWVSFSTHAVVGGFLSYSIKKIGDWLFKRIESKKNTKDETNR